jgi:hypothetical protein
LKSSRHADANGFGDIFCEEQGFEMHLRLLFSVALLAVLVCFWLFMTKPTCRDGLAASLGPRLDWNCLADGG